MSRERPLVLLTHTESMYSRYFGAKALAGLERHADIKRNKTGQVLQGEALAAAAQGCQVILSDRMTPGPAELFTACPDLLAFLRCAVDIRNVDLDAASAAGVLVCRATPGFSDAVSELGIGMMVDLARGISATTSAYHADQPAPARMGRQLRGSTLGLVGYGQIARTLARLATSLGMRVQATDPFAPDDGQVERIELPELLASSDWVVCLAVANAETENLMNADAFAAMRKGAYFINLSRGNLVDEAALEAALESGHLAGAAMDVGRAPDQMPSPFLARRPDVVATPHIGGLVPQAVEHQAMDTVRQVEAIAAGEIPPYAVNPETAARFGAWLSR